MYGSSMYGTFAPGRCTLRIAEFRKGVFCGIKILENAFAVELCQLNRCKVLQSARPSYPPASLCQLQEEIVG